MNAELIDLLRQSKVSEGGSQYTHWTYYGPKGCYYISANDIEHFWLKYCSLVASDAKRLCLAERCKLKFALIIQLTHRCLKHSLFL